MPVLYDGDISSSSDDERDMICECDVQGERKRELNKCSRVDCTTIFAPLKDTPEGVEPICELCCKREHICFCCHCALSVFSSSDEVIETSAETRILRDLWDDVSLTLRELRLQGIEQMKPHQRRNLLAAEASNSEKLQTIANNFELSWPRLQQQMHIAPRTSLEIAQEIRRQLPK